MMRSRIFRSLWAVLLLASVGCAGGWQGEIAGEWRWISSDGGMLDESVPLSSERILQLQSDGRFVLLDDGQELGRGMYSIQEEEEPDFGRVPLMRLSPENEMPQLDSVYVVEVGSDSLSLISPWSDAWNHRFVRIPDR